MKALRPERSEQREILSSNDKSALFRQKSNLQPSDNLLRFTVMSYADF